MNVFWDEKEAYRPELRIPGFEEDTDAEYGHVAPRRAARLGSSLGRSIYHRVGKNGRLYIEDDVERYCPDRDVLIEAFRQLELLRKSPEAF